MRKVPIIVPAILVAWATAAGAQTAPAGSAPRDYSAVVSTGVTAGHVVSGLFDVDFVRQLNAGWDVYVELGRMADTRTADLDDAAAVVTAFLGPSAAASPKQPATYGDAGVRYKFPTSNRVEPYAGVGIGVAKVTRNVDFTVNGTNVNSVLLDTYGVQLGTDLSGSQTKALFTFSVGAQVALRNAAFADISYRYGRIFLEDAGLNTNRIQFGIGVRF